MNDKPNLAVPPTESGQLDGFAGDPNFMLSLARGLLVFRAFADKRKKLTIAEIAAATGLKRSTAYRCLYTLVNLGYLENEGNNFIPRASTRLLGSAYFSRDHWEAAVQPILDGIRDRLNMTCALGTIEENYAQYVVVSQSLGSLTLIASVGRRLPLYCTAVGRILLAAADSDELARYMKSIAPVAHTPHTTTAKKLIVERIEEARAQGYAVASQEIDLGVRAVAVPVYSGRGEAIAALMAGGEISVLHESRITSEFVPELQRAASEIGKLWQTFQPSGRDAAASVRG